MKWGRFGADFFRNEKIQILLSKQNYRAICALIALLTEAWGKDDDYGKLEFLLIVNQKMFARVINMTWPVLKRLLNDLQTANLLNFKEIDQQIEVTFPDYAKYKHKDAISSSKRQASGRPTGLSKVDKNRLEENKEDEKGFSSFSSRRNYLGAIDEFSSEPLLVSGLSKVTQALQYDWIQSYPDMVWLKELLRNEVLAIQSQRPAPHERDVENILNAAVKNQWESRKVAAGGIAKLIQEIQQHKNISEGNSDK